MMYEFIVGQTPFGALTHAEVFEKVLKLEVQWPEKGYDEGQVTPEAIDLIQKFLTINPNDRLGTKSVDDIKNHPFFKDVNWNTIRKEEPLFIPEVEDILDTTYFNIEKAAFDTEDFVKERVIIAEEEEQVYINIYVHRYGYQKQRRNLNILIAQCYLR